MSRVRIGDYLVIDSGICHGQITFEGTRIPVDTVLAFLSNPANAAHLQQSISEVQAGKMTEREMLED